MLIVLSDTHSTGGPQLTDHLESVIETADLVVHAGDFMREPVLDAFISRAETFRGVYGNNDDEAIRSRLPAARTVTYEGFRFALTHTQRGGQTALSLFGRERDADAVLFGHSHKPTFEATGPIPLLNPGSHAQPRGYRPGYAVLEPIGDRLRGRLRTPDGETFDTFELRQQ